MVYQRRQIITESERNRILGLYERSKLCKDQEKDIILEQVKLFSEHLDEYIEKPNKITLLKK